MGDPRLLRVAQPVTQFGTPELQALAVDLHDTMVAANGAGLAAPQIGVDLQVVLFGFQSNARYPEAPPVPPTWLVNPVIEPLGNEEEEGWEGCLSVPGLRGVVPRWSRIRYRGYTLDGAPIEREVDGAHRRFKRPPKPDDQTGGRRPAARLRARAGGELSALSGARGLQGRTAVAVLQCWVRSLLSLRSDSGTR